MPKDHLPDLIQEIRKQNGASAKTNKIMLKLTYAVVFIALAQLLLPMFLVTKDLGMLILLGAALLVAVFCGFYFIEIPSNK